MSKRDALHGEILSRLIDVRYRFGERIQVKELAGETKASRQPIGAALQSLAADGFVRIIPQVGCEVIRPAAEDIEDFFGLYALVEGRFAQLAAARRSAAQLREMAGLLHPFEDETRAASPAALLRWAGAFHGSLRLMAGTEATTACFDGLHSMASFLVMQCSGGAPDLDGLSSHLAKIRDAIEARDPAGADRRTRDYIDYLATRCVA
ncbi:GntR family transcriptional regulator [Sphingopyxis sp.]|uniref:GntR family transcriptional regulator n=1 Tax=Sphingopyxis sp. TaxID=1908224 RepID=UPI0035B38BCE